LPTRSTVGEKTTRGKRDCEFATKRGVHDRKGGHKGGKKNKRAGKKSLKLREGKRAEEVESLLGRGKRAL